MKCLPAIVLFCLFSVVAVAQDQGIIECQDRTSIPAWEGPGSIVVYRQLSCGQPVSIVGSDSGYAKVQIRENVFAYVKMKYIRLVEAQSISRAVAPEAQIKAFQEKSSAPDKASPTKGTVTSQGIPRNSSPGEKPNEPNVRRFDVAGMFTWARTFNSLNNFDYFGWTAAVGGNLTGHFGLEANVGGNYWHSPVSVVGINYYQFLGGPRISFPGERITPFVHFLVGLTHANADLLSHNIVTGNALTLMPGGGLDINLSRHLAIRAFQADWQALHSNGEWGYKNIRIGGGLVVRF